MQPFAKAAGLKLLVASKLSYPSWSAELKKKALSFGVSQSSLNDLEDAAKDHSCIAFLKSSSYLGPAEVADALSKLGAKESDVNMLKPKSAEKFPEWGSFDTRNHEFIYWMPIDIEGLEEYA